MNHTTRKITLLLTVIAGGTLLDIQYQSLAINNLDFLRHVNSGERVVASDHDALITSHKLPSTKFAVSFHVHSANVPDAKSQPTS